MITQTGKNRHRISPGEAVAKLRANGFSVSEKTVLNWCNSRKLKNAKKLGGRWYIDLEELEAMME